jgi:DNA-binding SARP family transcriptional activator
MLCRLLGPLEVRAGGDWTGVSAPKWRALLAVLLLSGGQVVSTGQLAGEVWGDDPPPGARKLISGYVARLRQLIGDPDGRVLVTRAPGYRLMVARAGLDAFVFEQLVAAARLALGEAGGDQRAAEFLAEALALWRGPALADVPRGPLVAAEAARLEELRLDALELRAEAGIRGGRAAELVPELRQLTAGYPLRERLWHQLMRALDQGGRPAEALQAYAQARKILAEELGADPGPDLQQLHRRLLVGGFAPAAMTAAALPAAVVVLPAAAAPAAVAALPGAAAPPAVPALPTAAGPAGAGALPGAGAPPAVLRQLPAMAAHFAGRAAELAALTGLLEKARAALPGTVVISAIDGMPGVGKTALAVQAGHLLADRFPDRQLFVDLHGHTPGQQPADPAGVLAALLAADGVDPRYLPAGLDGRAAMWRDRMAGRRALLILDNAASSAQIAPLLPGTAGCLVLVTSRRFLGDLPAALEVPLDVLPPGSARAMFMALAPRAASDPDRVAELVALCGHLPLAITLLARLLTRHRSWNITDLIAETRARLLTVTAENRTVAATFQVSYQDLGPGRQRFFRSLGLHPGPDTDAYAAAALAGLPLEEAAGHLDALHADRLMEEPVPGRYRMHNLIRQYARSLAATEDTCEQEQAVGRLLDYYQHTAWAADVYLTRYATATTTGTTTTARSAPPPAAVLVLPGRDQALAWMTAERVNLLACIDDAAAHRDLGRVVGLTAAIASHLRADGPWTLAITLHTAAVRAARHLGDRLGEANARNDLGDMRRVTGDYQGAAEALEQALDLSRDTGDRLGEANALLNLGTVRQLTDDRPAAAATLEHALEIYRDTGDRLGEANALLNLGEVRRVLNDYKAAADALERALGIYCDTGDRSGEANALFYLAVIRHTTGDFPAATDLLNQALTMARSISNRLVEANALCFLGDAQRIMGDFPGAADVLERSLVIYRRIGSRLGEANALCWLGGVWQVTGDFSGAADVFGQALAIYRDIGDRLGEANVLCWLADARQAGGDLPGAAEMLEQALVGYRDIGDRVGEAEALNQAGAVQRARGDLRQARASYREALELACTIDNQLEEARALEGIGRCAAMLSTADTADDGDESLRQALEIYQRLGALDAARLADEIGASLGDPLPGVPPDRADDAAVALMGQVHRAGGE